MITLNLAHVVDQIVMHQFYRKGGEKDAAIHFHFDVSMDVFKYSPLSFHERCGLHLLFHSLPDSRIVSAFSAVTPSPFESIKNIASWYHEGSHDLGWRDMVTVNDLYFTMAEKINNKLEANGKCRMAPIDMSQHTNFKNYDKLFDIVRVNVIRDNDKKIIEVL